MKLLNVRGHYSLVVVMYLSTIGKLLDVRGHYREVSCCDVLVHYRKVTCPLGKLLNVLVH